MIFWWFPRFCLIFSFEAKPSKIIKKSSKNNRFVWLKQENLPKSWIFIVFQAKRWWFFDDFSGFVWFSLLKQNLQKSSKNYIFFSIVFFIRLKIISFLSLFLSFCLSSQDTSLHPTKFLCQQIIPANVLKVTLPRFEQRQAAMYMDFGHMMPRHLESRI